MLAKKYAAAIALAFMCHVLYGQEDDWQLVEETNIKGSVSGVITHGYVFRIDSRNFYMVNERIRQRVRTRNPGVKIFQSGFDYKLEIEDFDEPIICKKINDFVDTQIDGQFNGWDGETIFKMRNGQIWQQASYGFTRHYAYSPNVLIYELNGSWTMSVEELDETLPVKKLDQGAFDTQAGGGEVIETRIDGEFKGWDGETIFKMRNGQIWQQASYGYTYHYAYSPDVIIYKSGLSWKMKVEGMDEAIEVKKIN